MTEIPFRPIDHTHTHDADRSFRLKSGTVIRAGWLAHDVTFLTRSLRYLLRPQSDAIRAEFDLDAGDIGVLAVLAANPGCTQIDLAASLVLKKSAVTRVVQRLETRGFISRRRSTRDRRANRLSLTDSGTALAARVGIATQAQQADWFEGIADPDRAAFFEVLHRLVDRLAESRIEGAPEGADDD